MKKFLKSEKTIEWLVVALVFAVVLAWSLTTGRPGGPDESMRYDVAKYLYEHPGTLPRGEEPEILNKTWGISYAFYPILSYMVSAVFMTIAGLFSTAEPVLLHAARMADVLFITGAAWLVVQTGKRLFDREKALLFSCLVVFLPGFLFLGTYVNTDSLALLAAAMILYAWVRYLDEGWTWKNCILLAVGMAVCFLSYYNAYGWILWSFFFFCFTVLFCGEKRAGERWKFLFSRGAVIAGITFVLAGWWFIRNYFLYDGDILGRNASTLCAEKYAKPGYKPSEHLTPALQGWKVKDFLLYQNPGWRHNWLMTVLVSFVGVFGTFDVYMNETVSKGYLLFLLVGCAGAILMYREFYWKKRTVTVERSLAGSTRVKVKTVRTQKEWSKKGLFNLAMAAALITPVVLFVSYAYNNDNQAQGRYIISAVYPLMYFVVCGYAKLLERLVKKEALRQWFYRGAAVLWSLGGILTYFLVILPHYR